MTGKTMRTQKDKAEIFRSLHQRDRAFVIPNPWDAGTAKFLAHLGFEALASTSAGFAFSLGKRDRAVAHEAVIEHLRTIVAATDLPVSADLENGFGDAPKTVEEIIRLAADAGVVGGSIEDSSGRAEDPIYEFGFAVERIHAAVGATRSLGYPFMLTARAENYLHGRPDLADTIRRLQAFQEAGADVLYAPGLMRRSDIEAVVSSVDRPVNVLMGMQGINLTVADLSQIGVKRVSTGGALARAAFGAVFRAAVEMRDQGTFHFVDSAFSSRDLNGIFDGK
jgi:2-methylisocitrate lyase-like PEP mutase family enzyme